MWKIPAGVNTDKFLLIFLLLLFVFLIYTHSDTNWTGTYKQATTTSPAPHANLNHWRRFTRVDSSKSTLRQTKCRWEKNEEGTDEGNRKTGYERDRIQFNYIRLYLDQAIVISPIIIAVTLSSVVCFFLSLFSVCSFICLCVRSYLFISFDWC